MGKLAYGEGVSACSVKKGSVGQKKLAMLCLHCANVSLIGQADTAQRECCGAVGLKVVR